MDGGKDASASLGPIWDVIPSGSDTLAAAEAGREKRLIFSPIVQIGSLSNIAASLKHFFETATEFFRVDALPEFVDALILQSTNLCSAPLPSKLATEYAQIKKQLRLFLSKHLIEVI